MMDDVIRIDMTVADSDDVTSIDMDDVTSIDMTVADSDDVTSIDMDDVTSIDMTVTDSDNAMDVTTALINATKSANDVKNNLDSSISSANTARTNLVSATTSANNFVNQAKSELNQIKNDTSVLKDEANTSAVNAKSSETKAKEYADNLQASTDDISQLKEDLANIEDVLGITTKTVHNSGSGNGYTPVKIVTGINLIGNIKYNFKVSFEQATIGTVWFQLFNSSNVRIDTWAPIHSGENTVVLTYKSSTDLKDAFVQIMCEPSMSGKNVDVEISADTVLPNRIDGIEKNVNILSEQIKASNIFDVNKTAKGRVLSNGFTDTNDATGFHTDYIRVDGAKSVTVWYGSAWATNYYHALYKIVDNQIVLLDVVDVSSDTGIVTFDVPTDCEFVRLSGLYSHDGYGIYIDYLDPSLSAKRTINGLNYEKDDLLCQITKDNSVLSLLHFSDIHASIINFDRLLEYYDSHKKRIDDVICTGDIVSVGQFENINFWDGKKDITKKWLMTLGNHDQASGENGNYHDRVLSMAGAYEKYMTPYIDDWSVVSQTGKTYWYKDYIDKHIRLIGMESTLANVSEAEEIEENQWLSNVLSDAKAKGYAIVIAEHYPPSNPTKIDSNFTAVTVDMPMGSQNHFNPIHQATVQTFIDDGGEFICYLCGHTHCDFIAYNSEYPSQMFVTVSNSGNAINGDQNRVVGERSQDLFNVVGFDTINKLIKICRVGADTDVLLRSRKTLCIDYTNKKIISSN